MPVTSDPDRPGDGLAWSKHARARFRAALLDFFGESARDLPWRAGPDETADPYKVLVSEVMLQQTRVDTVIPYFDRWMERFPAARDLAGAEPDEVLTIWQGLGYYSRARNLHGAVREIVERYDGELPRDPATLETLPGVGPYTAGAVASIAFGVPAPAVDGNVRRVLARLKDHPSPPPSALRRWASELVDPDRPGTFNQALMELGSLVCTPRDPSCDRCPVSGFCAARAAGTERERPLPRARGKVPRSREAVAILVRRDREGTKPAVLLRRRGERGLLAGMWELPGRKVEDTEDPLGAARDLALETLRSLGGGPEPFRGEPRTLPSLDHVFSHRKIRYVPFRFDVRPSSVGAGNGEGPPDLRWTRPGEIAGLPIPAAQRKLLSRAGV